MRQITRWKLSDDTLRLQIWVKDDIGLESAFNRHANQRWTTPDQTSKDATPPETVKVLDDLCRNHPILGQAAVLDFLGIKS